MAQQSQKRWGWNEWGPLLIIGGFLSMALFSYSLRGVSLYRTPPFLNTSKYDSTTLV